MSNTSSSRLLKAAFVGGASYLALVGAAYWPDRRRPLDPHLLSNADDRFVTVGGQRLRYQVEGSGPPVVLIHGFAGSIYTWRKLVPLLAVDHTVYTIDLLGFGLSDKPANADYSLESYGRQIVAALAGLKLSNVTLIGHSMGGVVAAYASLNDVEGRIGRLALIGANFYRRNRPSIPPFFPLPRLLARRFYSPDGRANSLRRCYANPAALTDEVLAAYLAPTRIPGAVQALTAFFATPGPDTYAGLPARLRRPTMVIWGAQDKLWPLVDAHKLQADISGAELEIIYSAGHMVQEEQPKELAKMLRGFIAR